MDSFLSNMPAQQALEWELFARENPSFEDKVLHQIAHIATVFAGAFIKKRDRSPWKVKDFMPFIKEEPQDIVSGIKKVLTLAGDDKAKKWAGDKIKDRPKVKGTDGKLYNYVLEEFANRTKPPRRRRK
jgi:hypothetical protein